MVYVESDGEDVTSDGVRGGGVKSEGVGCDWPREPAIGETCDEVE